MDNSTRLAGNSYENYVGSESLEESSGIDLPTLIQERPNESMLLAILAGVGVGVFIGSTLAGSDSSTGSQGRRAAEQIGKRLLARFDELIPDSLSRMNWPAK